VCGKHEQDLFLGNSHFGLLNGAGFKKINYHEISSYPIKKIPIMLKMTDIAGMEW
jgi:hypothetical protein